MKKYSFHTELQNSCTSGGSTKVNCISKYLVVPQEAKCEKILKIGTSCEAVGLDLVGSYGKKRSSRKFLRAISASPSHKVRHIGISG